LPKTNPSQSQVLKPKRFRFAFVRDIFDELRKVTWPTRRETIRLTIMVIVVCAIVGIFLGALDYGFAELVAKVFLGGK
jgi:preprotein translocase subunit SecE